MWEGDQVKKFLKHMSKKKKRPFIKDIPSIKEISDNIETLSDLKTMLPFLEPILKKGLVNSMDNNDQLSKFEDIKKEFKILSSIPDKFNNLFSSQGWIIYDSMSIEVAKEAIRIAEAGNLEEAEAVLVNYYDYDTVSSSLNKMKVVSAFQPRMELAQKALIDYKEGRYHACVPVVLALLDGLVNEIHCKYRGKHRGFFTEDVNLTAWDSIAAHDKGLKALSVIFQKSRSKTNVEKISIPYRHGILHGMDLSYDNKIVAAKSWAALFATRDWALRAERGELEAPPPKPEVTWEDILEQLSQIEEEKRLLDKWEPRILTVGIEVPSSGKPENFQEGSPERKLVEYLTYWQSNNYGYMAKCILPVFGTSEGILPSEIREVFKSKKLKEFSIIEIVDEAPQITDIRVNLTIVEADEIIEKTVSFRLGYFSPEGRQIVREKRNGKWFIVTGFFL